jgi:hypothetical protein
MCFQKKTTIIKSGLGDAQYAQLQGNQGTLGENLETGFTGTGTRFNTVDSGISGLKTDIGGITTDVNTNTNTRFDTLGNTLSGYADANNNRFDQFDRNFASNTAAVGANNTALNTLQGDVTGGFNDQAARFNTVDAANTAMQGTADQGFADQAQGFSDAETARSNNAGALAEGLIGTNTALETGFGDAVNQVGQVSSDVLAGQADAATNLDSLNTGFNSYAAQDAMDQAAMKSTQDGFVSSFDTYTDRYAEDTSLANKTRADMQKANANANIQLRDDIGEFAQASSSQLGNVAQGVDNQIRGLEGTVEGGFSATSNAASKLKESLASGMENVDANQIVAARDMASIASTQTDLSMDLRQNFNQLGNSVDDTGNLIASSIDDQGNTIARSMDEQGNLILDRFDVTGQGLGRKTININTTLEQLGNLGNRAGSNAAMGNLSPAYSAAIPQTGFAAPFAATR